MAPHHHGHHHQQVQHQQHRGHHHQHGHGHHGAMTPYQMQQSPVAYSYGMQRPSSVVAYAGAQNNAYAMEHKHKHNAHMAELGALGAGAFAVHEAHQVKADPAHASRHRMEEAAASAAVVGLGAYAFHEHQLARQDHKLQQSGHHGHHKKHHHGLFK